MSTRVTLSVVSFLVMVDADVMCMIPYITIIITASIAPIEKATLNNVLRYFAIFTPSVTPNPPGKSVSGLKLIYVAVNKICILVIFSFFLINYNIEL